MTAAADRAPALAFSRRFPTMHDVMRILSRCRIPLALLPLAACTAFGPNNVERDRFDYNQVIGASNNQQMLLNVVRMHYRDVPVFMAVSSVLTQYVYSGAVGVNGATGVANGFDTDSVGGSATLRYFERPTITYAPMTGPEFAAQMLTPIPPELVFALVSSGWPARDLLHMTLERVNDVQNVPFRGREGAEEFVVSEEFTRLVDLLVSLGAAGALEVQRSTEAEEAQMVIVDGLDPETDARLAELRDLLGLAADVSRFRVVSRRIGRGPDEVTIRIRSLLALMGVMSRGVVVTPEDGADPALGTSARSTDAMRNASRLAVRSTTERPPSAYVAVQYRDRWFFIDDGDLASREAFGLLNYLFLMMASRPDSAGPLITVPVS